MAVVLRNFYFLTVWVIFSTVYLCQCCMEGDGYFGWQCDNVTGCFCKQGQRCQQTLGICPEHCVDNPWGIGCHDEHGNLAYGKPASQSNTNYSYTDDEWFSATLAVDGNNSTADSDCTRTHHQLNTYWTVDLEGLSVIREVTVLKPATVCPQNDEKLCIKNDTSNHFNCTSSTNAQCFGGVLRYNISPPILARHVTILKTGQQTLRLCEVIVRGYTYPYNVAFGKRAEQINVINEGDPGRAIDGKTTVNYYYKSCTHTNNTLDPWWEVDLGQQYVVYSVTLLNRGEYISGGGRHLRDIEIWIGNSRSPENNLCAARGPSVPDGASVELKCQGLLVGETVTVSLSKGPLVLCEVTIKGYRYKECANKKYGPECRSRCNCKDENEQCHSATGSCVSGCAVGWYGRHQGDCEIASPYIATAPTIVTRTKHSVTIRWEKWSPEKNQGIGTIQSYGISFRREGEPIKEVTVSPDNDIATVQSLADYTEYNVYVTVRNGTGHNGMPSPIITVRTCGEPVAPPEPTISSYLESTNRSAYIELRTAEMTQAIHRCDEFAKLNIRYEGELNDSGAIVVPQVNDTQLINITNLATFSRYTIYLTVVNNLLLEGPPMTMLHTTAEGLPNKMRPPFVTNVDENSIELEWREPSPPGGKITEYEISYCPYGHFCEQASRRPSIKRTTIQNLLTKTSYTIKIRAQTAVGYGEYSDVIAQHTGTTRDDTDSTAIVAGILVAGAMVAAAIVIAVVLCLRYRRQAPSSEIQANVASASTTSSPDTNEAYCNIDVASVNRDEPDYCELHQDGDGVKYVRV